MEVQSSGSGVCRRNGISLRQVRRSRGLEQKNQRNETKKGKINEKIDYTKDGENKVAVTGKMNIHGVEKDVLLNGTLTVKGTQIIISTKFVIHVADYNIKVPSLYVEDIAENVDVKLDATLEPFKKN